MQKPFKPSIYTRLRAAWAVLCAQRCVVITYDPNKPSNILGEIHTGMAMPQELPERLANACLVSVEYDKIDSEEGQWNALRRARELLDLNPRQRDT